MINFRSIDIEGFASFIGKHYFKFGKRGLNIIKAPNGSGKTKLISSIYWAIYGQTLGDHTVEPWDTIKDPEYQGTKVVLIYYKDKVSHIIIRCKDYKGEVEGAKGKDRLIYFTDGDICELKDKKDIQKRIIQDLGFSEDLFKNSILFGQKLKRFVGESGTKKKEILEQAFEVDYIFKIRERRVLIMKGIQEELTKYNTTLQVREGKRENLMFQLSQENIREEHFKGGIEEEKSEKGERITTLEKEIKELEGKLKTDYDKEIASKEDKISKILIKEDKDLQIEFYKLSGVISNKTKEIKALSLKKVPSLSNIPRKCSRCGMVFNDKHLREERKRIEDEVKEIEKSKLALQKDLDKHNLRYEEVRKLLREISINLEKCDILRTELAILKANKLKQLEVSFEKEGKQNRIKELESEIKSLEKKEFDITYRQAILRKLLHTKLVLKKLQRKISRVEESIELEKWLINDPLSNSGLKAFIFDSFLQYVNKELKNYIQHLGFKITLEVDMKSANKDINTFISRKGNIVSYSDLSGGQQQLCDIAIAFSVHQVVTDNKNINLLILDEIFESLDANNIDIVSRIIEELSKNKLVYLITHQDNFVTVNGNQIEIGFENGVSSIS